MNALGPEGTNGHEAAMLAAQAMQAKLQLKHLPGVVLLRSHIDVLEETLKRGCLGLVAIENDGQGLVGEVVNYFAHDKPSAHVIGDIVLPIQHDLLIHPDANESEIREAISHRQALNQTREQREKLKIAEGQSTTSTAEAARLIASWEHPGWRYTAAIASPFAAEAYGLRVMREHIEDQPGNTTRFYILGQKQPMTGGNGGKTALIFAVSDKSCSLGHTLLSIGSGDDVNISSLDRVRLGSKANSVFFCEFDAHVQSEAGKNIMRRLHTLVAKDAAGRPRLRVLGSWSTS
ncbi:MAG: prephenate dehydratase domain-containing protein [bacterium]|nr:prephenate dehydratase domain-containing protein [bacterium]